MRKSVKVEVPAKLFIAGEYGVTRPGGLALIAALETDFFVSITESSGLSRLTTNVALADYEFDLQHIDYEADNLWKFALAVLAKLSLPVNQQLVIDIQSDLGYGKEKKGYGSSASVVVGVLNAVDAYFDLNIHESRKFELAAKAHKEAQGSGSMGDVAAVSMGDIVRYQAPDENWQNWSIATVEFEKCGLATYVIRTDESVKTDEKLSISLPNAFYRRSDELVQQLYSELQKVRSLQRKAWSFHFDRFKDLLLQNQQLLIDNLPKAYLTDKLALALELANAHDNLAAKVSGAGFGENIIVFAENDTGIAELTAQLKEHDIVLEKIKIAKEKDLNYYDERSASAPQE